jgi:hypothetical protein
MAAKLFDEPHDLLVPEEDIVMTALLEDVQRLRPRAAA